MVTTKIEGVGTARRSNQGAAAGVVSRSEDLYLQVRRWRLRTRALGVGASRGRWV